MYSTPNRRRTISAIRAGVQHWSLKPKAAGPRIQRRVQNAQLSRIELAAGTARTLGGQNLPTTGPDVFAYFGPGGADRRPTYCATASGPAPRTASAPSAPPVCAIWV
ncbi:hypothetical protein ABT113_53915, partial [Streptomyces mirabilis]